MSWYQGITITEQQLTRRSLTGRVVALLERSAPQEGLASTGVPQPGNALAWDTAILDILGGWSPTTNPTQYRPAVPGLYLLSAKVGFPPRVDARIRGGTYAVNGDIAVGGRTVVIRASTGNSANSVVVPMATTVVQLNGSTDYVEVWAIQTSGDDFRTHEALGLRPQLMVTYAGPLP